MILNVLLGIFGSGAVFLAWSPCPKRRRWAPIIGLLGQPLWAAVAINGESWGILALVPLYTIGWCRGLLREWRRPDHHPHTLERTR